MKRFRWLTLTIFAVALAVSCRGKQSMASKSAAAYREAVAKGIPVGAGGHGGEQGHEMPSMAPDVMQKMQKMPGMQHGPMVEMDHSKTQHESMQVMRNMPEMQHGSMAETDHSKMQHGTMQGMSSMPGMQHGGSAASVVIAAPSTSSGMAQLSPRSTLQQDEFDRPAAAQPASQTQSQPPTGKHPL